MSETRLPLSDKDRNRLRSGIPAVGALEGARVADVRPLAQHASSRSYHRVALTGGSVDSLVVMKLGEEPLRSDERVAGPAPERLPFVELGEALAEAGLPVPRIYADWSDEHLVLLEDLGERSFEDELGRTPREAWLAPYREAVRLLARFHAAEAPLREQGCIALKRRFGADLLSWELAHFQEWGLAARGIALDAGEQQVLDEAFGRIVARLTGTRHGLSHRDFQSRNLMWTHGALRVIDFQDALVAPVVYDLVALLRDSYVVLRPEEVRALLAAYAEARREVGLEELPQTELASDFRWMTVQRKLKDAGRFVFIERVKGDPSFLVHIPDSLAYVREALAALPELAALRGLLEARLPEWQANR